ncbi:MAG TPA: hypothetical protein PKE47_06535, partial [Verrucomicrobiota bacterium]|nr:hypothetical protein [Verrucomicrobiota bacterium]
MFGFLKRPAEVLDHWIAFTDGLVLPPSEFYAAVEAELAGRKIPGLQVTRLELPEGGLLSEKRTYLRLVRERLVFDVGAAPFGTGFFFSCRTAEIPLVLKPGQLLAVLLLVAFVLWWLVRTFGLFQGPLLLLLALAVLAYVLRNAVAMGLQDLDRTLVQS